MKKYLLLLFGVLFFTQIFAQGPDCASSDPFCTGTTATFPAGVNQADATTSQPGNNYDCLLTAPNPAWYYMEIATGGNLEITMSNSNNVDIDFALWGPFNNLSTALSSCGSLGSNSGGDNSVVDCSYSTTATEVANITNAQPGEVYILLVTNFSNTNTNISFTNTGGTATTDCSIVNPCVITGLTANPSACNTTNNTYSVSGTVTFTNPPASGTLTITNSCGGSTTVNAPFGASANYNFTGLTSNGTGCIVTATFSADPTCTSTANYTAPPSCTSTCFMTNLDVTLGACDPATGNYTISGFVEFTDPPASGTLTVSTCGGQSQVFNAPFASPTNFNFNAPADGTANCNVTAVFSADPACTISVGPFTEPVCLCNMDYLEANIAPCDPATNTYVVDGFLEFTSPPSTGQLIVENCDGTQQVFNPPFSSPTNYSIGGLTPGTGGCSVTAYFTADPTCTIDINYTAPPACDCPVDAGTFTSTIIGSGTQNYLLCWDDQINIAENGDFVPANNVNQAGTVYDPGLWLLAYSCPPTVFAPADLFDAGGNPVDPCLLGLVSTDDGNWTILNDLGDGSTIYFVPLTMYDMTNGFYSVTNSSVNCYDLGTPIPVTFVPEITATQAETCIDSTLTVTVNGGLPEMDANEVFTASNLQPATAFFVNTTTGNGGTIVVGGLLDGDMYSFDITDANGCPITITGGPFNGPDPSSINPAGPFCLGDPAVNLTANIAGGTWSGTGITNTTTGTFNPATAGIGTHTITYTPPGCAIPSTLSIVVNDQFDATINPVGPFCESDPSVTLTAADAGGTWSGTGITNAATGAFDPATAGSGTHTITYSIPGSCGDTQTTTITVNPDADATINPAGPFCESDPATIITAVQTGGTWSGTGITNATTGAFDPAVAGVGLHQITYTIGGPCGDVQSIQVQVNTQLDATINPAGPFCESNTNTFLAAADPGGTWSGPGIVNASTGEFSPAAAGPGTHTITYSVGTGACADTQTITIQVIADADATVNPAGPFCVLDTPIGLTSLNPGGTWSGPGITNASNGTFDPATAGVGTHTITYSISGVCGDAQSISVVVIPQVNTTITPVGPYCFNAASVNVTAATAGGTWSGNGITNSSAGTFNPGVAGPGVHTITYTISGSCGNTSTIDIVVNDLPVVTFSGATNGCAPVTATIVNTTANSSSCTWLIDGVPASTDCLGFTQTFTVPGCYDVTLQTTDGNGCSNQATTQDMICVYAIPDAEFTFGPLEPTVLNPTINFTNQSTGASTYSWDFAGLGTSGQVNPTFVFPDQAGQYLVCLDVTSANGCTDSVCEIVTIYDEFLIYVPNAFTVDGDGVNDVFLPIISGHDPTAYEFYIFNRWGELIFESRDSNVGWDGYHKGVLAKEDVYVWKLKAKRLYDGEKRQYYGHVTLLK